MSAWIARTTASASEAAAKASRIHSVLAASRAMNSSTVPRFRGSKLLFEPTTWAVTNITSFRHHARVFRVAGVGLRGHVETFRSRSFGPGLVK